MPYTNSKSRYIVTVIKYLVTQQTQISILVFID